MEFSSSNWFNRLSGVPCSVEISRYSFASIIQGPLLQNAEQFSHPNDNQALFSTFYFSFFFDHCQLTVLPFNIFHVLPTLVQYLAVILLGYAQELNKKKIINMYRYNKFQISTKLATWQSSVIVCMVPLWYCGSMSGETPKLSPINKLTLSPFRYTTWTWPLIMTDQESSFKNREFHETLAIMDYT